MISSRFSSSAEAGRGSRVRVVVLAPPDRDYSRTVETFIDDFRRQTGRDLEVIDPNTPEGSSLARLYDVVEYPTVVALSNDGQLQNMWRGQPLPMISEVSYYVSQS